MNRLHKENHGTEGNRSAYEFPAEAFAYNDDVTPEAVAALRAKAERKIGDRNRWKQIDGFGQVVPA